MWQPKRAVPLDRQRTILARCIAEGVELSAELARLGLDYDCLRYTHNVEPPPDTSPLRTLADLRVPSHGIPLISLFSGCGGMDLGFEAAGFEHVALVDNDRVSCDTLRRNRPTWNVIGPPLLGGDVSDRERVLADLHRTAGVRAPFEGVVVGGPPCQPFSIAANQRFSKSGEKFKRIGFAHSENGPLLFDFLWLVGQLRPKVLLIENVLGLIAIDGGQQLSRALQTITRLGYVVGPPLVLDAADYDVPQKRQRLFIVGSTLDAAFWPPPPSGTPVPCEKVFRLPIDGTPNHVTRLHKAQSILRYMHLQYGQRDHLGRVDRLDPRKPSKTVIAGGARGGGRSHLHPHIPRTLSVRECARLQTFPDDYAFTGSAARQFTQVGNALPPVLACKLGTRIHEAFYEGGWGNARGPRQRAVYCAV
jgi:DNA (cytosine-5)-methyltransferase 1